MRGGRLLLLGLHLADGQRRHQAVKLLPAPGNRLQLLISEKAAGEIGR